MKREKKEEVVFWKDWKFIAAIFIVLLFFSTFKVAFFTTIIYIIVVFRNGVRASRFTDNEEDSDIKMYSCQ